MCLSLRAGPNTFGLVENDEVGWSGWDDERWLDQTTRRLATPDLRHGANHQSPRLGEFVLE
jgi:hypothetical protein